MSNQNFMDAMNLLNLYSVYLALENLYENREQSAHNDVQAANSQQADYLLKEISSRFEDQNVMLKRIIELLEQ